MKSGQQDFEQSQSIVPSIVQKADVPASHRARPRCTGSLRPVGLVMIVLTAWAAGCGEQPAKIPPIAKTPPTAKSPDKASTTPKSPPERPSPRLWLDDEMAQLVKSFGYDEAYVIRWQNGEVDGWVEFDGEKGVERESLNSLAIHTEHDKHKAATSDALKRVTSGWIVVAMHKDAKLPGNSYRCHAKLNFTYEYEKKGNRTCLKAFHSEPIEGNVRLWSPNDVKGVTGPGTTSFMVDEWVELQKYRDGKETPWLKVRIVPPPK
jgi:hypothetical protein